MHMLGSYYVTTNKEGMSTSVQSLAVQLIFRLAGTKGLTIVQKKRYSGRCTQLKTHEPGGTKLKTLPYKKIVVVKIENVQICQS
jgi:hypothetical protein